MALVELQPPDQKRDLWFQCSWCCCPWRLQGSEIFCCCLMLNVNENRNVTWTLRLIWSLSWIYHEDWHEYVPEIHLSAWILQVSETESLSCQESVILI